MNKPLDGQTDRQSKSTRWAFTAYESQWPLFDDQSRRNHPGIADIGWNPEICPETNRKHYQGYILLRQTQRLSWLLKIFPAVHMEIARNWLALIAYCKKEDTRIPGTTPVHHTNSIPTHFQYAEEVAKQYLAIYGIDNNEYWVWQKIPPTKEYERTNLISLIDRLDDIIQSDIRSGKRHAAWITTNPQWETMWKKWGRSFILSFSSINAPQVSLPPPSPCSTSS